MTHEEFEHGDLQQQRAEAGRPYLEFLRSETFELGLYELAAGCEDGQKPHDEDEIYVVLSGRGRFVVDGDDVAVGPGSMLFVAKHACTGSTRSRKISRSSSPSHLRERR